MRLLLLLFLIIGYPYGLFAQEKPSSASTSESATASKPISASQTATDQKLSDLQQTVNELKNRLEESNDPGFPIGKFVFAKTVQVYEPISNAFTFLPSDLSDVDKSKLVELIHQGYTSTTFQSRQDPKKQISFTLKKGGFWHQKKPWNLSVLIPASSTNPYITSISRNDFAYSGQKKSSVEQVKHVLISVQSGMVNRVEVNTERNTYTNRLAPILLRSVSNRYADKLYSTNGEKFITFGLEGGIVKSYDPYTAKPYLIDDQEYHYTPSSKQEDTLLLKLKTDSDNYVKIRFFTDLLGLSNQRNPVTQVEGTLRVVLNSLQLRNSRKFWFQHIQLRIGNGHFDSKQDTLRLTGVDTARTELFRKANWYGNVKLALISHRGNVNADLIIGLEGRLVKHVYIDQLKDQTVFVGGPLTEASFNYSIGPNASLNLHAGTVFTRANRQPDIPNNNRWYALPYLSAEADYAPFNSPGSRIFFRLNHYWNWTISEPTITQAQIGYSGTLNGILGGKAK